MALPKEQIDSIISQLNSFGDDGVAFDNWMFTISNYVRAHGHVGAFKSTARGLWLSGNKRGVERLVRDTLGGQTHEELAIAKRGDLTEPMAEEALYKLLCKMGVRRGDTLSVHSAEGDLVQLRFNDDRLPERPKKVQAPKPNVRKTEVAAPTPEPTLEPTPDSGATGDPGPVKKTRKPRKKKNDNPE